MKTLYCCPVYLEMVATRYRRYPENEPCTPERGNGGYKCYGTRRRIHLVSLLSISAGHNPYPMLTMRAIRFPTSAYVNMRFNNFPPSVSLTLASHQTTCSFVHRGTPTRSLRERGVFNPEQTRLTSSGSPTHWYPPLPFNIRCQSDFGRQVTHRK